MRHKNKKPKKKCFAIKSTCARHFISYSKSEGQMRYVLILKRNTKQKSSFSLFVIYLKQKAK